MIAATMFACTSPEKKAEASASDDPRTGTFSSKDAKSQKVKELIEAYMKNDKENYINEMIDSYRDFKENLIV